LLVTPPCRITTKNCLGRKSVKVKITRNWYYRNWVKSVNGDLPKTGSLRLIVSSALGWLPARMSRRPTSNLKRSAPPTSTGAARLSYQPIFQRMSHGAFRKLAGEGRARIDLVNTPMLHWNSPTHMEHAVIQDIYLMLGTISGVHQK
jgi:hypothetical protein